MKSVREYVLPDMWNHNLMSGGEIRALVEGTKYTTPEEQLDYLRGIITMFPHMLLANFSRWMWEGSEPPKPYEAFMDASVQSLQSQVFPVLEEYWNSVTPVPFADRGEKMVPILTDLVPKHVLTGFYDYMFTGSDSYKDISEFWTQVQPLLNVTAKSLAATYADTEMDVKERAEVFLFIGARMPFLILKRWYDWQFGPDKMDFPPPPPQD